MYKRKISIKMGTTDRKDVTEKDEYRRIFMRRSYGKAKINEQALQQDESYKVEM